MSVTLVLPAQLRDLAAGQTTVRLPRGGATVGDVLDALGTELPSVYDRILNERREVRPHVNVFVGREDIRWSGGLATPVPEGSEVVILPSVSGG